MSGPPSIRVTKLARHPDGPAGRPYWTARLTEDGRTIEVDCYWGSWQVLDGDRRRECLPRHAAKLQERVRPLERAEGGEAKSDMTPDARERSAPTPPLADRRPDA